MHVRTLLITGALLTAACARTVAKLSPAPGATVAQGPGEGAMATAAGVRVTARAEAWQWDPSDLKAKVTPILLELQNDGANPVLVRYNRISLTDEQGHHFNVMPPYDINATVTEAERVENPFYGFDRFAVAPYLSRWYPRLLRYNGNFAYDATYYSPYLTEYHQVHLPTTDMIQRALPEGVLSAGGRVSGFVYFQKLDRDAGRLTLAIDVVNAQSGSVLGTAQIPFVAR
jgi:hypothetical protein